MLPAHIFAFGSGTFWHCFQ